MNRTEHLLDVLSEEAVEVAKEVSKALRFGLYDYMPEPPINGVISNRERINHEIAEFDAMVDWLRVEGILPSIDAGYVEHYCQKRKRVERYMDYARKAGALAHNPTTTTDEEEGTVPEYGKPKAVGR